MKDKKDKSPAKFIGTLGAIQGVLGGAGDVLANRRAAKAAGQKYSFRQGLGDFVQGGISGIIGVGPTVNRAGAPGRSINDLQPINTIQDPGMQSAQQAAAYNQFNNIAQTMPPAPTMKKDEEFKPKGTVLDGIDVTYYKSKKDAGFQDKEKPGKIRGTNTYKPSGDNQDMVRVSPATNTGKTVRKMKRAAVKEDQAKIKAERKAGTLDSSDFANEPYRTLKGKF